MKSVWKRDCFYEDIKMVEGADLQDLIIDDHFSVEKSDYRKAAATVHNATPTPPAIRYYARSRSLSEVVDIVGNNEDETEISALLAPSTSRINELRSSPSAASQRTRSASPPMAIPRKNNSPSPRTVSPLIFSTGVTVGSPDLNPLPVSFLIPPLVVAETSKPAAALRKAAPPIKFRRPSSLESFHTIKSTPKTTPGTTPTSAELLAQEAGSVGVVPGLSL